MAKKRLHKFLWPRLVPAKGIPAKKFNSIVPAKDQDVRRAVFTAEPYISDSGFPPSLKDAFLFQVS